MWSELPTLNYRSPKVYSLKVVVSVTIVDHDSWFMILQYIVITVVIVVTIICGYFYYCNFVTVVQLS